MVDLRAAQQQSGQTVNPVWSWTAGALAAGSMAYSVQGGDMSAGQKTWDQPKVAGITGGKQTGHAMEREQIADMIGASEARSDTKLERAMGEFRLAVSELRTDIKELKAASASKATVVTTGVVVVGIMVALVIGMMTIGQQWFGLGLQSHDVLMQAAKEGAAQAIATVRRDGPTH